MWKVTLRALGGCGDNDISDGECRGLVIERRFHVGGTVDVPYTIGGEGLGLIHIDHLKTLTFRVDRSQPTVHKPVEYDES